MMSRNSWALVLLVVVFAFFSAGCSSFGRQLKSWVSGAPPKKDVKKKAKPQMLSEKSYSQSPNYSKAPYRNYKRMTKQTLKDESKIDPDEGSLWVMEGQGSYLFSQNVMRMIGDPLIVTMNGDPKDQLESKAQVIQKLTKELEERRQKSIARRLASQAKRKVVPGEKEPEKAPDPAPATPPKPSSNKELFSVKNVPTRVVERMVDGNYRVKGSQPFMIGSKEYRVIVTGIVRAEDFNEQGVQSSKLLDANFDIVSSRGQGARL